MFEGAAPQIGSRAWYVEFERVFGESGEFARALWVLASDGGREHDAHSVVMSTRRARARRVDDFVAERSLLDEVDCERVELAIEVAAWALFHQDNPSYATQMNMRLGCWRECMEDEALTRYYIRQLVAQVSSDVEEIAQSAWYVIGVDFFECSSDARVFFAPFLSMLFEHDRADLERSRKALRWSSYVTWDAKAASYRELVSSSPELHDVIAHALADGYISPFTGSIDDAEALALFEEMTAAGGVRAETAALFSRRRAAFE